MTWTQTERHTWELATNGFDGTANLRETNSGFVASVQVENTQFDMELADERDFFERKKDAVNFLRDRMEKHDYE